MLISVILGYYYYSGSKIMVNTGDHILATYKRLITENIQQEIDNCLLETQVLISGLDKKFISDLYSAQDSEQFKSIDTFLKNNSKKYPCISFLEKSSLERVSICPVKVFGGELKTQTTVIPFLTPLQKEISFSERKLDQPTIFSSDYIQSGRMIQLFIPMFDKQIFFNASISLDFIIEETLNNVDLLPELSASFANLDGIVISTQSEIYLNKYLEDSFKELEKNTGFVLTSDEYKIKSSKTIWSTQKINSLDIILILAYALEPERKELNSHILKMLVFAIIIILIVLVFVRILGIKLTASLNKITFVTQKVSEGNFSCKIDVSRRDELGDLISAFNIMVDRLDENYKILQNLNIELGAKITELQKTKAELSQKQRLALIGETISKISHEIQNKIGGVSIWVQNLEYYNGQDETIQAYIQEMKKALNSFMNMLTNFKRFYREPQLNYRDIHIKDLFETTLLQFSGDFESKKITLNKNYTSCTKKIFVDPVQLEEAIINLLVNAIYYSPTGGNIDFKCEQNRNNLHITIADQGPGIPKEYQNHIFQPFFTSKSSGSGLGLAIVQNIIHAHNGEIFYKNLEKGGVVFTVRIPVQKPTEEI